MNLKLGVLFFFLLILLLLQSGCMTSGNMLEQSAVTERLHEGEWRQDVRRVFGEPQKSETGSNGETLDEYFLTFMPPPRRQPGGERTVEVRYLTVLYDGNGRVEKFKFCASEVKGFLNATIKQWRTDLWIDASKTSKIKRGVTTKEDLIQLLGPVTYEGLDRHGNDMVCWLYGEVQPGFANAHELLVLLNANSVVADYIIRDHRQ